MYSGTGPDVVTGFGGGDTVLLWVLVGFGKCGSTLRVGVGSFWVGCW